MPYVNKTKQADYQKTYYTKHREKILQRHQERYAKNINGKKDSYYLKEYGITYSDFLYLKGQDHNKCAICGTPSCPSGRELSIDHNHITGQIRGILCMDCNTGLGKFKDSIDLLQQAKDYLQTNDKTLSDTRLPD